MTLKFVVEIAGKKVVLDAAKLEVLWDIVHGADVMDNKWVGSGKGTTGSSKDFIPIIKTYEAHTDLAVTTVSQEQIEAIKFVTKHQEQ